jgi:hypothetical protein
VSVGIEKVLYIYIVATDVVAKEAIERIERTSERERERERERKKWASI